MKIQNSKIIVAVIVLLALIVGGFWFLTNKQKGEEAVEVAPSQVSGNFEKGKKAPDFTLIDFDGREHKLSDYQGKAVVLDFWAGWCPFCIEEMPELEAAQNQYPDDLVIIGVHRTSTESKETGFKFAQNIGVSYLLVTDTNGALYQATQGFGMPVAVFIDREGIVTEIKSGPKTKEEIEEKISALLKE